MTCGIYKIENNINGKVYIGRSINIERRWNEHRRDSISNTKNKHLYCAFNKYGIENFNFSIIEECKEDDLYDKEKFYIQQYNSYVSGYNETFGGEDGCPSSLLDKFCDVVADIKNKSLSLKEIAEKYNVTPALICMINSGERCYNSEISYPIRPYKENGLGHFCIDCGSPVSQKANRCLDCYKKHISSFTSRPTAAELVENILKTSIAETGRKYGVADNTIKRWLKEYGEPYMKNEIFKKYGDENFKSLKQKRQPNHISDSNLKVKMYNNEFSVIFENSEKCSAALYQGIGVSYDRCLEGIRRVLRKKRNTYHGYMFEYIN